MRSSVQIATNVFVGLFVSHAALAAPVQNAVNGLVMRSLARSHAGRQDQAATVNPIIPDPTENTNPIIPDPTETTNPIGPDPTATADSALASLLDQLTKGLTDSIIFDPRSSGQGRNARQSLEEPDGSDGDQFHILPFPFDPNGDDFNVIPIPFDPNSDVVPDPSVTVSSPEPDATFSLDDPSVTVSSPEPDATFSIDDPSVTVSSPEPDATFTLDDPTETFFPGPSVTVAPDLTTTRLPLFPTLEVDPLGKNFIVRAL